MWFKKWRKSVRAIAIIAELPPTTQPCRTVTVLSCVHYPLEKNDKHGLRIVGRRFYVESLVRCNLQDLPLSAQYMCPRRPPICKRRKQCKTDAELFLEKNKDSKRKKPYYWQSTFDTKPTITAPQVVTSCSITTGLATGTAEISIDGFCFSLLISSIFALPLPLLLSLL